jgi:hypothetical protein
MFIARAEYVEIFVPTGNTKQVIQFPDLPNLRTAKLFGFEVYDVATHPITVNGNAVQGLTEIRNSVTTLYFDGGDFIQIPTISLFRNNSTTFYANIPEFMGQKVVWAKSYITLTNSAGISGYANKSFVYNVYYKY